MVAAACTLTALHRRAGKFFELGLTTHLMHNVSKFMKECLDLNMRTKVLTVKQKSAKEPTGATTHYFIMREKRRFVANRPGEIGHTCCDWVLPCTSTSNNTTRRQACSNVTADHINWHYRSRQRA